MKTFTKGLLFITAALCLIVSCDKPNEVTEPETPIIYQYPSYVGPDSILNEITKPMVDAFNRDNTISEKYAYVSHFPSVGKMTINFSGLKDKHPWCKIVSVDKGEVITEYLSPDTIQEIYIEDLGYGETREHRFFCLCIDGYGNDGNSELFKWTMNYEGYCKYEFKSVTGLKTLYDKWTKCIISNYSAYIRNICYSFAGDSLYTISENMLDLLYMGFQTPNHVLISSEDLICMYLLDRNKIQVGRKNLKTGNNTWLFEQQTSHNLYESGHEPRVEYSIEQIQGSQWQFQCIATAYSGKKVKFTIIIDVDNPPAEITITEEEL